MEDYLGQGMMISVVWVCSGVSDSSNKCQMVPGEDDILVTFGLLNCVLVQMI